MFKVCHCLINNKVLFFGGFFVIEVLFGLIYAKHLDYNLLGFFFQCLYPLIIQCVWVLDWAFDTLIAIFIFILFFAGDYGLKKKSMCYPNSRILVRCVNMVFVSFWYYYRQASTWKNYFIRFTHTRYIKLSTEEINS